MSNSKAAPGFPYDHLSVLGFERLHRYVPPKQEAPPPLRSFAKAMVACKVLAILALRRKDQKAVRIYTDALVSLSRKA